MEGVGKMPRMRAACVAAGSHSPRASSSKGRRAIRAPMAAGALSTSTQASARGAFYLLEPLRLGVARVGQLKNIETWFVMKSKNTICKTAPPMFYSGSSCVVIGSLGVMVCRDSSDHVVALVAMAGVLVRSDWSGGCSDWLPSIALERPLITFFAASLLSSVIEKAAPPLLRVSSEALSPDILLRDQCTCYVEQRERWRRALGKASERGEVSLSVSGRRGGSGLATLATRSSVRGGEERFATSRYVENL
ncbi:Protein of unknown function [Gryllus bimaculatus]|nr:Protein of unknown function [Gryllus bimaculatus]